MNFLTENQIVTEIKKLLKNANEALFAVSFWGKGALNELGINNWKGKNPLRVVCNLESGATNPSEIEKMRSSANEKIIDVRSNKKLHAKVYWTDKGCIITSANASANGLSYEGKELTGWIEAGYMVTDKEELAEIKKWFLKTVWKESNEITDEMLDAARELWNKKQISKKWDSRSSEKNISLLEYARKFPENIQGKISVVFYDDYIDEKTQKKAKKEYENSSAEKIKTSYRYYEDFKLIRLQAVLDINCVKETPKMGSFYQIIYTSEKNDISIARKAVYKNGEKYYLKLDTDNPKEKICLELGNYKNELKEHKNNIENYMKNNDIESCKLDFIDFINNKYPKKSDCDYIC